MLPIPRTQKPRNAFFVSTDFTFYYYYSLHETFPLLAGSLAFLIASGFKVDDFSHQRVLLIDYAYFRLVFSEQPKELHDGNLLDFGLNCSEINPRQLNPS